MEFPEAGAVFYTLPAHRIPDPDGSFGMLLQHTPCIAITLMNPVPNCPAPRGDRSSLSQAPLGGGKGGYCGDALRDPTLWSLTSGAGISSTNSPERQSCPSHGNASEEREGIRGALAMEMQHCFPVISMFSKAFHESSAAF